MKSLRLITKGLPLVRLRGSAHRHHGILSRLLDWPLESLPYKSSVSSSSCFFQPQFVGSSPRWQHYRPFSATSNNSNHSKSRPDPFSRRPTAKCDPYGQGGKPLPILEANTLLATLNPQWTLVEDEKEGEGNSSTPQALVREFVHADFMAGAQFVAKVAAVAQLNNHFPSIQLKRQILSRQKAWQVVTRIRCHTLVLGGLSTHDFHLAMLIDVEAERSEVKELILSQEGEEESPE